MNKTNRSSTTMPVLRSRLLPRISFRSLLILTAVSSLVFSVAYAADEGGNYARAVFTGLVFVAASWSIGVALFFLSWAGSFLSRVLGLVVIGFGLAMLGVRLLYGPGFILTQTIWLVNFQFIGWYLFAFSIRPTEEQSASPFAADQLPPQILAPRDPVS